VYTPLSHINLDRHNISSDPIRSDYIRDPDGQINQFSGENVYLPIPERTAEVIDLTTDLDVIGRLDPTYIEISDDEDEIIVLDD
jgi:hypothetical protein